MILLFPFYIDAISIISINLVFNVSFKNLIAFSTFILELIYLIFRNKGIAIICN